MKKKKPYGNDLREQLEASARDRLYSFLLDYGGIRGALLHATRLVNEMRANHELGVLETLLLGHGYIAAGLMSANLKGSDRLAIRVACSDPVKGLSVEATAFGEVRGYLLRNPIAWEHPVEPSALRGILGRGILSITRSIKDAKQPFTGQVRLEHGNLAEDLAHYFLVSEQTPSAFALSVQFDKLGEAAGAGGLFLQVMPGTDEDTIARVERIVEQLPSIGEVFASGVSAEDLLQEQFAPLNPLLLDRRRIAFMCHCSKVRFGRFLSALPQEELSDILEKGPFPVVTTCFNCNSSYSFPRREIEKLYTRTGGQTGN